MAIIGSSSGAVTPPDELVSAVRATLAELGEERTAAKLQLSRSSVAKLAAQMPCRKGTLALAALRLNLIAHLPGDLAGELVDE